MNNQTIRMAIIVFAIVTLLAPFASTTTAQNTTSEKSKAKPTVILLHADWCGACKKLAPTMTELKAQYGDRLNFIELDVTNEETTRQASAKARELGIGKFFEANKKNSSLVAVVGAQGKILFHTHYSINRQGSFERATYVSAFDKALAQS